MLPNPFLFDRSEDRAKIGKILRLKYSHARIQQVNREGGSR